MLLAYEEAVQQINKENGKEEHGPKPRKPTLMERLKARRLMAHNKGDWNEVYHIEKSISWKQSARSAARKRKNKRRKYVKHYLVSKEDVQWRKHEPSSDYGRVRPGPNGCAIEFCKHDFGYCIIMVRLFWLQLLVLRTDPNYWCFRRSVCDANHEYLSVCVWSIAPHWFSFFQA